jgi:hypothetical protein
LAAAGQEGSWIALLERQLRTVIRHSRNVRSHIALDDNTLIDDGEDAKAINLARPTLSHREMQIRSVLSMLH